jgi:hypothetical protein
MHEMPLSRVAQWQRTFESGANVSTEVKKVGTKGKRIGIVVPGTDRPVECSCPESGVTRHVYVKGCRKQTLLELLRNQAARVF